MSRRDQLTKKYIGRNDVFADVVNNACFEGKKVVNPDELKDISSDEWTTLKVTEKRNIHKERYRDLLKECNIKTDGESTYIIFGIENQSEIHYAMPIKVMLYDALNYDGQIQKITTENKTDNKLSSPAEFLSGITKDDKIKPVITITVFFGAEDWDGPTSLHDMLDTKSCKVLSLVNDYKINIITPGNSGNPDKYSTQFGLVMRALSEAKNIDSFAQMLKNDDRFSKVEYDAAQIIGEFTGIELKKEENVDMNSGYINVSEYFFQKGISQGITQGEENIIRDALLGGSSPEDISKVLHITLEKVKSIQDGFLM